MSISMRGARNPTQQHLPHVPSGEHRNPVCSSCSCITYGSHLQRCYPVQYVDAVIEDLLSFQPSAQQLLAQLQEKVLLSQQAAAAEAQKFSGASKQGEELFAAQPGTGNRG